MQDFHIPTAPPQPQSWNYSAYVKAGEPVKDLWELEENERDITQIAKEAFEVGVDLTDDLKAYYAWKAKFTTPLIDSLTDKINEVAYYHQLYMGHLYCNRMVSKKFMGVINASSDKCLVDPSFKGRENWVELSRKWLLSKIPCKDSICAPKDRITECLGVLAKGKDEIENILRKKPLPQVEEA